MKVTSPEYEVASPSSLRGLRLRDERAEAGEQIDDHTSDTSTRIDRLPTEDKTLLQSAAVVGYEVPFAILREIAQLPEERLKLGLTDLQAGEFLQESKRFPELEYTFKIGLLWSTAGERYPIRHTFSAGCPSATSGAARRPTANVAMNERRSRLACVKRLPSTSSTRRALLRRGSFRSGLRGAPHRRTCG